jgi:hypothetical protein
VQVSNDHRRRRKQKEIWVKLTKKRLENGVKNMHTILWPAKEFRARQFVKSIESLYTCSSQPQLNTATQFSLLFKLQFNASWCSNNTNIDSTTTNDRALAVLSRSVRNAIPSMKVENVNELLLALN